MDEGELLALVAGWGKRGGPGAGDWRQRIYEEEPSVFTVSPALEQKSYDDVSPVSAIIAESPASPSDSGTPPTELALSSTNLDDASRTPAADGWEEYGRDMQLSQDIVASAESPAEPVGHTKAVHSTEHGVLDVHNEDAPDASADRIGELQVDSETVGCIAEEPQPSEDNARVAHETSGGTDEFVHCEETQFSTESGDSHTDNIEHVISAPGSEEVSGTSPSAEEADVSVTLPSVLDENVRIEALELDRNDPTDIAVILPSKHDGNGPNAEVSELDEVTTTDVDVHLPSELDRNVATDVEVFASPLVSEQAVEPEEVPSADTGAVTDNCNDNAHRHADGETFEPSMQPESPSRSLTADGDSVVSVATHSDTNVVGDPSNSVTSAADAMQSIVEHVEHGGGETVPEVNQSITADSGIQVESQHEHSSFATNASDAVFETGVSEEFGGEVGAGVTEESTIRVGDHQLDSNTDQVDGLESDVSVDNTNSVDLETGLSPDSGSAMTPEAQSEPVSATSVADEVVATVETEPISADPVLETDSLPEHVTETGTTDALPSVLEVGALPPLLEPRPSPAGAMYVDMHGTSPPVQTPGGGMGGDDSCEFEFSPSPAAHCLAGSAELSSDLDFLSGSAESEGGGDKMGQDVPSIETPVQASSPDNTTDSTLPAPSVSANAGPAATSVSVNVESQEDTGSDIVLSPDASCSGWGAMSPRSFMSSDSFDEALGVALESEHEAQTPPPDASHTHTAALLDSSRAQNVPETHSTEGPLSALTEDSATDKVGATPGEEGDSSAWEWSSDDENPDQAPLRSLRDVPKLESVPTPAKTTTGALKGEDDETWQWSSDDEVLNVQQKDNTTVPKSSNNTGIPVNSPSAGGDSDSSDFDWLSDDEDNGDTQPQSLAQQILSARLGSSTPSDVPKKALPNRYGSLSKTGSYKSTSATSKYGSLSSTSVRSSEGKQQSSKYSSLSSVSQAQTSSTSDVVAGGIGTVTESISHLGSSLFSMFASSSPQESQRQFHKAK